MSRGYRGLVCGVGIRDIKISRLDFKNKTLLSRQYYLWKGMISRCYSGKQPYYSVCKVCPRWHIFSNFVEDLPKLPNYEYWVNNPLQRIALDKDILGGKHYYYAPQYCMFVSMSENSKHKRFTEKGRKHFNLLIKQSVEKYRKPIYAISSTSGLIYEFYSISDAAKTLNFNMGNVRYALKRKSHFKDGYYFYYSNKNIKPTSLKEMFLNEIF